MTPAERLAIELGAPKGDRDGTKLVPMLCGRDETGERVLAEGGWIYEVKLDGVRILADKREDRVALGYRKLRTATSSYPEIAEAVAKLAEERVVLDGEVVAFDAEGRPDFQRLGTRIQSRGKDARRAARSVPVVYVVFDVLVIGDRDVTGLPIEARKAILERVIGEGSEHLRLHPVFTDGKELFRECRAHRLEGVVAKREGSTYRPDDRSADWVKVKCELDADLVVVGWTEGEGKRSRLGALDVGAYDGDRLVVRGTVGSGLDEDVIDQLLVRLRALVVPKQLAHGKLQPKRGRRFFTKPEIVVSVRYMGITGDGLMRHPVFRGLRHDLAPEDCTIGEVRASNASNAPEPR
ncbi:MAG: ATP-dependent ligase, partial [Myxococcaceae bacterium]|nr:ATP-dependent ligase [Myxococcaceae bacterium]